MRKRHVSLATCLFLLNVRTKVPLAGSRAIAGHEIDKSGAYRFFLANQLPESVSLSVDVSSSLGPITEQTPFTLDLNVTA